MAKFQVTTYGYAEMPASNIIEAASYEYDKHFLIFYKEEEGGDTAAAFATSDVRQVLRLLDKEEASGQS